MEAREQGLAETLKGARWTMRLWATLFVVAACGGQYGAVSFPSRPSSQAFAPPWQAALRAAGASLLCRGSGFAPGALHPCGLCQLPPRRRSKLLHVLRMAVGGKSKATGRAARLQKMYAEEEGLSAEDDDEDDLQQQMAPIAEGDRLSIVIDQQLLSQHLALVGRAVNPSVGRHYPVLNNILLRAEAKTNTLALAGYDLAMGIETRMREGIVVKQSGMVAAPAKVLSEMIAKLPQGDLELICETKTLFIRSVGVGSHAYNIRVMPTDDFPALPAVQSEDIIMEGSDFIGGVVGVMYACAIDDSAALLKGTHVRILPGDSETRVEFAATDGHRLAVKRMRLGGQLCPRTLSATVPRNTLLEVERLVRLAAKGVPMVTSSKGGKAKAKAPPKQAGLAAESCPLAIRIDTEYAQFVLGPRNKVWTAVRIFSRLFDGIFPNYDELVPRTYSRGVCLSACLPGALSFSCLPVSTWSKRHRHDRPVRGP